MQFWLCVPFVVSALAIGFSFYLSRGAPSNPGLGFILIFGFTVWFFYSFALSIVFIWNYSCFMGKVC